MLNASQRRSEKGGTLDREACLGEIEELVRSPHLSGSEALCKLLRFLAHHALNSPAEHIKEYEIATQVFGRPSDFDPQVDSGVRVQMARLRTKLAEYYQSDGANDTIQVEVPKGSYSLSFRQRTLEPTPEPLEKSALNASRRPEAIRTHKARGIAVAILACALAAAVILVYISRRPPPSPDAGNNQAAQAAGPALRTFWGPFLQGSERPYVVFSNAEFVGNPITGMRYYDRTRDSGEQISQHYTGIGEVMGVEELEGLFLRLGRQFEIKRGGLFTLDDARRSNLIFVGSPTENLTLGEIPQNSGFAFKRLQAGQNDWVQGVVDLRPAPGENATYLPTPAMQPMQVDYAVVTLTHGLDRSRWTLILAGASTVGTQAAVDFACDPDSVKDLLRRLDIPLGAAMIPFEALLRVKVANDVPLTSEVVKVRKTD
jgi:hypothetical protein